MICPLCETQNNYYHKYCYNCGAKLIPPLEDHDVLPKSWDDSSDNNEKFFVTIDNTLSKGRRKSRMKTILLSTLVTLLLTAAAVAGYIAVSR